MRSVRYVAYYRVSTKQQGKSGLGLEAQQRAVESHVERTGGRLVDAFREVESGKKSDRERPELHKALQACRAHSATLLVATFDRLSRNAAFLLTLKAGRVPIIAADMPDVNEDIVALMAVVAQIEGRMISARTRDRLQQAKRRGRTLGKPENLKPRHMAIGREKGRQVRSERARERAEDLRSVVDSIRARGVFSARGTARELNRGEIPTLRCKERNQEPSNEQWSTVQARRLLAALGYWPQQRQAA